MNNEIQEHINNFYKEAQLEEERKRKALKRKRLKEVRFESKKTKNNIQKHGRSINSDGRQRQYRTINNESEKGSVKYRKISGLLKSCKQDITGKGGGISRLQRKRNETIKTNL